MSELLPEKELPASITFYPKVADLLRHRYEESKAEWSAEIHDYGPTSGWLLFNEFDAVGTKKPSILLQTLSDKELSIELFCVRAIFIDDPYETATFEQHGAIEILLDLYFETDRVFVAEQDVDHVSYDDPAFGTSYKIIVAPEMPPIIVTEFPHGEDGTYSDVLLEQPVHKLSDQECTDLFEIFATQSYSVGG